MNAAKLTRRAFVALAMLLAVAVYDRMRAARQKLVTADFKPSPHYPVTQGA